jgi:hypothetical protein
VGRDQRQQREKKMKRRRGGTFDLAAKRRREIVLHARAMGAADTEDFSRWLVAWVWHNRKAADQIWSVMNAARNMGREITEAEAAAIIEEASITRKRLSADNLARFLGVTYEQRQRVGLTTIGSINVSKRARKELRTRQNRLAHERRRRAMGMRPQSESLSRSKPWEKDGMSRRAWYRRNKVTTGTRGTTLSAPIFLSSEDKPVPPERKRGYPKGALARKERKRKERRLLRSPGQGPQFRSGREPNQCYRCQGTPLEVPCLFCYAERGSVVRNGNSGIHWSLGLQSNAVEKRTIRQPARPAAGRKAIR